MSELPARSRRSRKRDKRQTANDLQKLQSGFGFCSKFGSRAAYRLVYAAECRRSFEINSFFGKKNLLRLARRVFRFITTLISGSRSPTPNGVGLFSFQMPKNGFKGQWVEIGRVGTFADSTGVERSLDREFLSAVVANYQSAAHEAPLVVGHPKDNVPAFGWTSDVRLNGDSLEARFTDTDEDFENLVQAGRYKKRSASFYTNPPNLRHVGFLGAQPPAVKGLRDISFSDGDAVTISVEFTEETIMPNKNEAGEQAALSDGDVEKVSNTIFDKIKNLLGVGEPAQAAKLSAPAASATANFSEAQVREIANASAQAATQEILTKLQTVETENTRLRDSVGVIGAQNQRSEIVAFCESLGAEKITPALKNAGIVDFMAQLAADDTAAKTELVISFGEGDQKTEQKFSRLEWFKSMLAAMPKQIEFGEKFGNLNLPAPSAAPTATVDDEDLDVMRSGVGIKKEAK